MGLAPLGLGNNSRGLDDWWKNEVDGEGGVWFSQCLKLGVIGMRWVSRGSDAGEGGRRTNIL